MTHSKIRQYGPLIARLMIVALFLVSGFHFLTNFGSTTVYFASLGIPFASLTLIIVLIIKFGGSLMVATGIHAREGAWALIFFTLATIFVAHLGEGQSIQAFKNLSIIGGLLMVVIYGAGPISWGKKCPCPKCKKNKGINGVCIPHGICTCGVCEECTGRKATEKNTEQEAKDTVTSHEVT